MKLLPTPFFLAACLFAVSLSGHAADFPDNFLGNRQGFEWNRYALNEGGRVNSGKLLRKCLTECAREQSACTEQCTGSEPCQGKPQCQAGDQCTATCDTAHARCVESCNTLPR